MFGQSYVCSRPLTRQHCGSCKKWSGRFTLSALQKSSVSTMASTGSVCCPHVIWWYLVISGDDRFMTCMTWFINSWFMIFWYFSDTSVSTWYCLIPNWLCHGLKPEIKLGGDVAATSHSKPRQVPHTGSWFWGSPAYVRWSVGDLDISWCGDQIDQSVKKNHRNHLNIVD